MVGMTEAAPEVGVARTADVMRVAVGIRGSLPDDELALARAIVQATVDGWSEEADRVRLVKFLGPRAE